MLCFIIDHELLLRAVRRHVTCQWALLYIERWLTAPMVDEAEARIERSRGTPQRGVVSPILSNTFLNYLQFRYCPPSWGVYETGGGCVLRTRPSQSGWKRCCTNDEGRPLGVGVQAQASNRHKLRALRAPVVSVAGKGEA